MSYEELYLDISFLDNLYTPPTGTLPMFIPDMALLERTLNSLKDVQKGGKKVTLSDEDIMKQKAIETLTDQVLEKEIYNQVNKNAYGNSLAEKYEKLDYNFTNSSNKFKSLLEAYKSNPSGSNKTDLIQSIVLLRFIADEFNTFIADIFKRLYAGSEEYMTSAAGATTRIQEIKADITTIEGTLGSEIHDEELKFKKIVVDLKRELNFTPLKKEDIFGT